jgi:hypothetical protein
MEVQGVAREMIAIAPRRILSTMASTAALAVGNACPAKNAT